MNEKKQQLEQILNDFDCKLTDYLISHQLAEVKKQKKQAEILTDLTRLVSALTPENLLTCSEDDLEFYLNDWRKAVVVELAKLRDTIR